MFHANTALSVPLALLLSVLACRVASADDKRVYVGPDASMPVYQIGPIQIDTSRKRQATPQVVVQWRMIRPGVGSPTVRAITGNRSLILILAGVSGNRAGTLRFDYEGSTREPAAAAVWFEINRVRMPTSVVSNVSTLGLIDPDRLPRFAGAKELGDFEEKDQRLPPKILPQGFTPLLRTHPIVPGMTGKAAHDNKWLDAEILAVDSRGRITVKCDDPDLPLRLLPVLPSGKTGFFIVRPSTLEAANSNPRRFRPSANVLPGTVAELPADYVPLGVGPLPPGLPVKFAFSTGWRDGFVVKGNANQVDVQTQAGPKTEVRTVDRSTLIVSAADAKRRRSRAAAKDFRANLENEKPEAEAD